MAAAPKTLPAGAPVTFEYAWSIGPGLARLPKDLRAFVHFVDPEGIVLFTDDHVPSPPPDEWVPGRRYAYRRVLLSAAFPYVGRVRVLLGLFSPATGVRLALRGEEWGRRREYHVADVELTRPDHALFPRCSGLSPPEAGALAPLAVARFMNREAQCTFANSRSDTLLLLDGDLEPRGFTSPPTLTVATAGGVGIELSWPLSPERRIVRVRLPAAALGAGRESSIRLAMSASYRPRDLGFREDRRDLSLRLFGLVAAPVSSLDPLVVDGAMLAAPLPDQPKDQ